MNRTEAELKIINQLKLAGVFVFFAIALEIFSFQMMGFGWLPEYFILDLSIIFIIACLPLLISSNKIQVGIYSVVFLFQVLISFLNITLNAVFGSVATLDLLSLVQEAGRVAEESMVNIGMLFGFIAIFGAFVTISILMIRKHKKVYGYCARGRLSLMFISVLVLVQFVNIGSYGIQVSRLDTAFAESGEVSILGDDKYLYDTLLFETESFKKFGSYTFYARNVKTTFSHPKGEELAAIVDEVQTYLNAGESSSLTPGAYTGVSEGNNVIVLMVESLDDFGIDELLTPNLYNIKQNNVSVNNYYSKSKTNISEAFGILGSYTLSQSFCSSLPGAPDLTQNNYDYTLPNLLKADGYSSADYFVFHEKEFYSRASTHYNFGFDNVLDLYDFEVENSEIEYWGDFPLDSATMSAAMDSIVPDTEEAFMSWITTLVMHGPYEGNYRFADYYAQQEALNWVNPLEGTDQETHMKNYMAAAMDFDLALGLLMDDLEEKDILDETTILIYGDHNAYYHDLGSAAKDTDPTDYSETETYRVPFLIYDENLPAISIDDFSCPYDLMPTLMDLLGIEYNKNLYMGNSVLNENEKTEAFMAITGGIFDENYYTANGVDIYGEDEDITAEEREEFLQNVEETIRKVLILNNMYQYDVLGYE